MIIGIQSKTKGSFGNKDKNGESEIEKKIQRFQQKFDFPSIDNFVEETIQNTELNNFILC